MVTRRALILVPAALLAEYLDLPEGLRIVGASTDVPYCDGTVQLLVEGDALSNACNVIGGDSVTRVGLGDLDRVVGT